MEPKKDWMNIKDYLSEDHEKGVENFLEYAFTKLGIVSIHCPFMKCVNVEFGSHELVHGNFLAYRKVKRYTFWYYHRETFNEPSVALNNDDDDDDDIDGYDQMKGS